MDPQEKDRLFLMLVDHLKTLVQERDKFAHKVVEISLASPKNNGHDNMESLSPEKNHLALEVSEFKAKIRKLNQQLWVDFYFYEYILELKVVKIGNIWLIIWPQFGQI